MTPAEEDVIVSDLMSRNPKADEESIRLAIRAAYTQGIKDVSANWVDMAFCRLGFVRDEMSPADVEAVQHFLNLALVAAIRRG